MWDEAQYLGHQNVYIVSKPRARQTASVPGRQEAIPEASLSGHFLSISYKLRRRHRVVNTIRNHVE
jgi:hypothetical protein